MTKLIPLAPLKLANVKPSRDIGTPGELEWLPVSSLFIDPGYQRAILQAGEKNIKRMVEEFSWALFAPVVVAPRGNERYAIIDGQHRATAAVSHGGVEKLPCIVLRCSVEDEARAFATINGQVTKVHALMIFRARVVAGDQMARALTSACAEAAVTIAAYPKPCERGETMAVGTLQTCLEKYGRDVLIEALKTVTKTGDGNPGLLREGVIHGTCDVLAANPTWRGKSLLAAVERAGVGAMYREAVMRKGQSGTTGGSFRTVYAAVLSAKLRFSLSPQTQSAAVRDSSIKPPSREQLMRGRA